MMRRPAEQALAADALPRCLLSALNERAAEAQRYAPFLNVYEGQPTA
jgi:hypothetical protein